MRSPNRFSISPPALLLAMLTVAGLSCGKSDKAAGTASSQTESSATADGAATPTTGSRKDSVVDSGASAGPASIDPTRNTAPTSESLAEAPAKTPAGSPIGERARSLLARMIQTYQGAQTYQDDTEFRVVHHLQSGPLSVRFERPNKVDARLANARIVSDGKQRTVVLPDINQHVTGDAPEELVADQLYGDTVPPEVVSPIGTVSVPLKLMLAEDPWHYVLEDVVAVSVDPEPATIDGLPHDVIRLDKVTSDAVLYLNQQTGLIRRLEVDLTAALLAQGQPAVGRVVYTLELHDAAVGAPQKPFRFQLPAGSRQVEAFEFPDLLPAKPPAEPEPPAEADEPREPQEPGQEP